MMQAEYHHLASCQQFKPLLCECMLTQYCQGTLARKFLSTPHPPAPAHILQTHKWVLQGYTLKQEVWREVIDIPWDSIRLSMSTRVYFLLPCILPYLSLFYLCRICQTIFIFPDFSESVVVCVHMCMINCSSIPECSGQSGSGNFWLLLHSQLWMCGC